jgi:hypothetical protein
MKTPDLFLLLFYIVFYMIYTCLSTINEVYNYLWIIITLLDLI